MFFYEKRIKTFDFVILNSRIPGRNSFWGKHLRINSGISSKFCNTIFSLNFKYEGNICVIWLNFYI